ncbi:MAG: Gfo/Idh/MocA family oxidoreductase [Candidatus Hodarchaeota archaeon]
MVTLRFESGTLATIEASWAEPDLSYQISSNTGFIINGEDGTIRVDPSKQPSEKITELFGSQPSFDEMSQFPAFVDQVGCFAKAIRDNAPVPVSAEDGLKALKVARAALESLKTGKAIEL